MNVKQASLTAIFLKLNLPYVFVAHSIVDSMLKEKIHAY